MKYSLKDEDYLKVWMYFQDRATSVKGAMFTTLTWTLGLAAAIIAFIFATAVDYNPLTAEIKLDTLVLVAASAGLVICLYAGFMLDESAKHIRSNWTSADRCLEKIEHLGNIVKREVEDIASSRRALEIWNQLGIIVILFECAFLGLLVWSLFQLLS